MVEKPTGQSVDCMYYMCTCNVSMYICMYVCMYVCAYVCVYVCVYGVNEYV